MTPPMMMNACTPSNAVRPVASSFENEPHIDGRLVIDGGTYPIRGVEWLLRREDAGEEPRFVCTPVGEPAAA